MQHHTLTAPAPLPRRAVADLFAEVPGMAQPQEPGYVLDRQWVADAAWWEVIATAKAARPAPPLS